MRGPDGGMGEPSGAMRLDHRERCRRRPPTGNGKVCRWMELFFWLFFFFWFFFFFFGPFFLFFFFFSGCCVSFFFFLAALFLGMGGRMIVMPGRGAALLERGSAGVTG